MPDSKETIEDSPQKCLAVSLFTAATLLNLTSSLSNVLNTLWTRLTVGETHEYKSWKGRFSNLCSIFSSFFWTFLCNSYSMKWKEWNMYIYIHTILLSEWKENYYSPNTTKTYLTTISCTSCSSEFFNIWKLQGIETVVRKVTAECLQSSVGVFLIEQHIVKLHRNTFNTFRLWIM